MTTKLEVGQKWRDMDKRMNGRIREIVAIGSNLKGEVEWVWYQSGYKTRIRINAKRLRPPYFELVT